MSTETAVPPIADFRPSLGEGVATRYRTALMVVGVAARGTAFVHPSPEHLDHALVELRQVVTWLAARGRGLTDRPRPSGTESSTLPPEFVSFEAAVAAYVVNLRGDGGGDLFHSVRAVDMALLESMVRYLGVPKAPGHSLATAYTRAKDVLGFGDWWGTEIFAHQDFQSSLFHGLRADRDASPALRALLAAAGVVTAIRLMSKAERAREKVFPEADAYVVTYRQARLEHEVPYWIADADRLGLARDLDTAYIFSLDAEDAITGLLPRRHFVAFHESADGFLHARRTADALAALLGPRHWASLLACAQPFLDLQRARGVDLYTPRCLRA